MAAIERRGNEQPKRWVTAVRACLCVLFSGAAIYSIAVGHAGLGVIGVVLAFVATQLDKLERVT